MREEKRKKERETETEREKKPRPNRRVETEYKNVEEKTTRCRRLPLPDRPPRARAYHLRGSSFTIPISYRSTTHPPPEARSTPRHQEVSPLFSDSFSHLHVFLNPPAPPRFLEFFRISFVRFRRTTQMCTGQRSFSNLSVL